MEGLCEQLPKGPGCQPQLLLMIPPPGRRIPLLCLLRHSPAVTPRTAGFWMFPWGLAWGQGDVEPRVNVPQQAFVLLPLLSSLMLSPDSGDTQPKE